MFFIGGGLSPIIVEKGMPIVGLVEKLSVGIYFQWIAVLFIKFYRSGVNFEHWEKRTLEAA